jgi:hypothetical protein
MFLAFVTHDIKNNTLEAVWLEEVFDSNGDLQEYRRVKSRNYSSDQKEDFLADCGEIAAKYVVMAGW